MITVDAFRVLVEQEYGPKAASGFCNRFGDTQATIEFEHGMRVLDEVLANGVPTAMPEFGPTRSHVVEVELDLE